MNVVTIMESAKMEPAFAHQVGMANFAAYQVVLIIALIVENVLYKEIIESGNVSVRMNTLEKIVARSKKKIVMIKWITTQVCLIGQLQCCQLCHWLFLHRGLFLTCLILLHSLELISQKIWAAQKDVKSWQHCRSITYTNFRWVSDFSSSSQIVWLTAKTQIVALILNVLTITYVIQ